MEMIRVKDPISGKEISLEGPLEYKELREKIKKAFNYKFDGFLLVSEAKILEEQENVSRGTVHIIVLSPLGR